jgi:hypothetical protein
MIPMRPFRLEKEWISYVWAFLVAVAWLFWFTFLDVDLNPFLVGNYIFPIILGFAVGVFSGLPPKRVFRINIYGFLAFALIIAIPSLTSLGVDEVLWLLSIVVFLVPFAIFCALFGVTGAVLRRVVLRQEVRIHMKSWQWVLLIGGLSVFSDVFILFSFITELYLLPYRTWTYFAPPLISVISGWFALGTVTGAFYDQENEGQIRRLLRTTLASHGLFLLFLGIFLLIEHEFQWNVLLSPFFCLISTGVLALGFRVGHHSRKSN